jgi:hypothetical protein
MSFKNHDTDISLPRLVYPFDPGPRFRSALPPLLCGNSHNRSVGLISGLLKEQVRVLFQDMALGANEAQPVLQALTLCLLMA